MGEGSSPSCPAIPFSGAQVPGQEPRPGASGCAGPIHSEPNSGEQAFLPGPGPAPEHPVHSQAFSSKKGGIPSSIPTLTPPSSLALLCTFSLPGPACKGLGPWLAPWITRSLSWLILVSPPSLGPSPPPSACFSHLYSLPPPSSGTPFPYLSNEHPPPEVILGFMTMHPVNAHVSPRLKKKKEVSWPQGGSLGLVFWCFLVWRLDSYCSLAFCLHLCFSTCLSLYSYLFLLVL